MTDKTPAGGRAAPQRLRRLATAMLLPALAVATPAFAEIYKYRDAQGHWHFSDKPFARPGQPAPEAHQAAADPDPGASQADAADLEDLAGRLTAAFKPATPIEQVTLAVVSVETPMGVGSGFFISGDGLLLTNRHVVRPTESSFWRDTQKALAAEAEALQERRGWLEREGKRLEKMAGDLGEYEKAIRQASRGNLKNAASADYRALSERYRNWKREYDAVDADYQTRYRTHRQAQSDFDFKSSLARLNQRFTVVLKDDSKLQAQLLKVSTRHDLALLKVAGYRTPQLSAAEQSAPPQGQPVFAVGSPLGMRDYVTSGIVTQVRADAIVTDTQVLPGNSGGPLVDETGRVLGINTQKVLNRAISGEGFGIAIPLQTIRDDFGDRLKGF